MPYAWWALCCGYYNKLEMLLLLWNVKSSGEDRPHEERAFFLAGGAVPSTMFVMECI